MKNYFQKQPPEVLFRKKLFLNILQNSKEYACVGVCFLIKLQLIKKRLQHKSFPVNIAKFLRIHIWKNICEQLLLHIWKGFLLYFQF